MVATCQAHGVADPSDKAQVGFFSFTEITDPTEHIAYNEWHQLDHMPEQFPLPGIVHGQRWVRTPECAAASTAIAPFDAVHYLTTYLMAEPIDQTLADFVQRGKDLAKAGRFFDARVSHFARPLAVEATVASPRVLVSGAAIPYRPHLGVHITVELNPRPDGAQDRSPELEQLAAIDGVSGVWSFVSDQQIQGPRWDVGNYRVTMAWLDADVLTTCERIEAASRAADHITSNVIFRSPFMTITPWEWNWFEGEQP